MSQRFGNRLARLLDARPNSNTAKDGRLREVFKGDDLFKRIGRNGFQITEHIILPGEITGKHIHEIKYEVMYVSQGMITVFLKDSRTGEIYVETMPRGYLFDLPPFIAHTLYNPGRGDCRIFEFTNLIFDPKDSRRDVANYVLFNSLS